jgi:hypothetical protein
MRDAVRREGNGQSARSVAADWWRRNQTLALHYGPRAIDHPSMFAWEALKRLPVEAFPKSFHVRCALDLYLRPHYAFGIQQAALLAARLGQPAVSVIEFGVAGGAGLVHMERLAELASAATGVRVEVHGFDRAEGLPKPHDYRDLPYHWRDGFFPMDVPALRARLSGANLVLGDLAETVPTFIAETDHAPIGFIAIDVDYYSSSVDALRAFEAPDAGLLPRVWCYLDDVIGEDWVLHNEFVGELAAVREFNEAHDDRKLRPVNGLAQKRSRPADWCEQMMALHCFGHPDYDRYVGPPEGQRALTL